MKRQFASLVGNRKAAAAALAAAIILAVQFIQRVVNTLLNILVLSGQQGSAGAAGWMSFELVWMTILAFLPFALGVFLFFWLLAPLAAELRLGQVLGRSLLAAVAGAIVTFAAMALGSLLSGFDESAGLVFGWAYGAMLTASANLGWVLTQASMSAGYQAIAVAPLTVLAGVLVWLWVRARPVTGSIPADVDEV